MKILIEDMKLILNKDKITFVQIAKSYFIDTGIKAVILYRLANYFQRIGRYNIAKVISNHNMRVTGATISPNSKIGTGLKLPHPNGVVIGKDVELGYNVTIMQQVTLGIKNQNDYRFPKIGNDVYIGSGAKILGHIYIADGCIIGSNAVVTKTCQDKNSTLIGIPAKKRTN